jgi:pyroglutamyl-peptidase
MRRVLITGFEPFGGEPVNPAQLAGERLADEGVAGAELAYLHLPVVRYAAVERVLDALRSRPYDAVMMLGQAGGRTRVTPERIATNVDDFRIPDNAGNQPRGERQVPDGPDAYLCTLPVAEMAAAMRSVGVPAAISNSAGTFLCNHVTYGVLHGVRRLGLATAAGFVHLPYLPEQVARRDQDAGSMGLTTMVQGLRAGLRAVLDAHTAVDAGSERLVRI